MPEHRVLTLERDFTRADRTEDEYPLLPFEVPPGVDRLHVRYEFDHPVSSADVGHKEGNIICIGIFDPRGGNFLRGDGFRGWSGDARPEFIITTTEATPGYIAGPIQPGTWHVLLGLYQLQSDGCHVHVTVTLFPGRSTGEFGAVPPPRVLRTGPAWYRGDLHCHTHHSEAQGTMADLVAAARTQGLDFLAVTEHNTVSHLPELAEHTTSDLLLIPGQEITTFHGHANAWGVRGWQEFRCWTVEQMHAVREAVHASGALFSVNHPKHEGPEWEYVVDLEADCVEAWQGPNWFWNFQSLAYWDSLLRAGKRVVAVGGSDKHQGPFDGALSNYEIGTPTTWVWADELSERAILDGIRAGHVFISLDPRGPRLELTAKTDGQAVMMGDELRLSAGDVVRFRCRVRNAVGNLLRVIINGEVREVAVDEDDFVHEWKFAFANNRSYVRAEVIELPEVPLDEEPAALMLLALGNPIYLKGHDE
ncbi:MAG: CehA/McbA family metallohydrolase [Chloroflexota bacterium]|nr:CehA/McbA family metallohydrolase [Chloroflexota bacterium]